jgi:SAM-dependent methyltransferase
MRNLNDIGDRCPLTGDLGMALRRRSAHELIASYAAYSGMPLPTSLQTPYFPGAVTEYYCAKSNLKWYSPTVLGGSDFYEHLARFPNYYDAETWDKLRTIDLLTALRPEKFVDIGCGEGLLLQLAAEQGIDGFGLEMNSSAVSIGRAVGLRIYSLDDPATVDEQAEVVVTLQTLEHVKDPQSWLSSILDRFTPRYAIVAVPCHDTMLGKTSDPLVWPPHHATLWSGRALQVLAKQVGYRVLKLEYEPNSWQRFDAVLNREPSPRRIAWLPRFPRGRVGSSLFRALCLLKIDWVRRAHTALVLMERA